MMFSKFFKHGFKNHEENQGSNSIIPCHVLSYSKDTNILKVKLRNGNIANLSSSETLKPKKCYFLVGKDISVSKRSDGTLSEIMARDIAWVNLITSKKLGETIRVRVSGLSKYIVFCTTEEGLECKISVKDMCLSRINNVSELVDLGQEIDTIIKEFDYEEKKLILNYKNAGQCESDNYTVNQVVEGRVSGLDINSNGYYISLSKRMVGLIDKPDNISLSYGDRISVLIKKFISPSKVKLAFVQKIAEQ